jgi:hypothetical protein
LGRSHPDYFTIQIGEAESISKIQRNLEHKGEFNVASISDENAFKMSLRDLY